MNIAYLNCSKYDLLPASRIEGLDALGLHVFLPHKVGCGTVLADEEMQRAAESADLIVVGSNLGVRSHLVQGIQTSRKVFVDGSDFTGTINEQAYCELQPRSTAYETPRYRQILLRSMMSVSVAGAGCDTARFWEILAAGAMLLTQDLDLVIPHGFSDGSDGVTF